MAYIEVDVELHEFSNNEIASYVARNDELFQLVLKKRGMELEQRNTEEALAAAKQIESDLITWNKLNAGNKS